MRCVRSQGTRTWLRREEGRTVTLVLGGFIGFFLVGLLGRIHVQLLIGFNRLRQGPENSEVAMVLERGGQRIAMTATRLPPPSARRGRIQVAVRGFGSEESGSNGG